MCALVTAREPHTDGYAVARTIRAEYRADAVLIAMTGYGGAGDRALAAGDLVKPVSLEGLVRVLDQRVVDHSGGPAMAGVSW